MVRLPLLARRRHVTGGRVVHQQPGQGCGCGHQQTNDRCKSGTSPIPNCDGRRATGNEDRHGPWLQDSGCGRASTLGGWHACWAHEGACSWRMRSSVQQLTGTAASVGLVVVQACMRAGVGRDGGRTTAAAAAVAVAAGNTRRDARLVQRRRRRQDRLVVMDHVYRHSAQGDGPRGTSRAHLT